TSGGPFMPLYDEFDLLDEEQKETEQIAGEMQFASDLDRRKFVFMSMAAAAATTFGFGARAIAQGRGGAGGGGGFGQQSQTPPVPLDNMEAVSWTFQPYPGGTGALLEKTYNEKGVAAFKRQAFSWGPAANSRRSRSRQRRGHGRRVQGREVSWPAARNSVGGQRPVRGEGHTHHVGRGRL
ncbi:MAG: hypothetical protein ABJC26_04810, partial [Gemmatimonadaceae bacterium]